MSRPERKWYDPRGWHLLTWALFLLWLLPGVMGNLPIAMAPPEFPDPQGDFPGDPTTFAFTSYTQLIGFPWHYLQVHYDGSGTFVKRDVHYFVLPVDLLVVTAVQCAIAFTCQQLRRFRVSLFFWLTAAVALVFVVGRGLSATENYNLMFAYIYFLYLMPVVVAGVVLFCKWYTMPPRARTSEPMTIDEHQRQTDAL